MSIDQFADREVLWADEPFQFDLLRLFVQEDVDFVLEVQSLVQEESLDVVLLGEELLELCQFVLLAHQEEALPFEALSRCNLSLSLSIADYFARC